MLGVSLGKTHYLLRTLPDKGLVKMDNFRRHDNKLAYMYKPTFSGIAAKLNLAPEFLLHKEVEYIDLHHALGQFRQELVPIARMVSLIEHGSFWCLKSRRMPLLAVGSYPGSELPNTNRWSNELLDKWPSWHGSPSPPG